MKFLSLAALEIVMMTISSVASDENFFKMTIFMFPNLINFITSASQNFVKQ